MAEKKLWSAGFVGFLWGFGLFMLIAVAGGVLAQIQHWPEGRSRTFGEKAAPAMVLIWIVAYFIQKSRIIERKKIAQRGNVPTNNQDRDGSPPQ